MCGIAGISATRAVNRQAVEVMNDHLRHRGPDDDGIWIAPDARVILGHRRLAIIDPTPGGAQPMVSDGGEFVLTFNGEIYNFIEVRERLIAEGARFRSQSDSEVLLKGYEMWGESILRELNGMFAFVIYDQRRGRLFCARDRFGEKPFLFVEGEGYFAFASEYKALLALTEVSHDVDLDRLLTFLDQPRRGLDNDHETIFTGIQQLLPGEFLSVDLASAGVRIGSYWQPGPAPDAAGLSHGDAVERFRSVFMNSVAIRMRSDVPVGSCLSGGLDSSSIVCLNRQQVGEDADYHVFTGRFGGAQDSEWPYAQAVIQQTRVSSHLVEPTPEAFLDELPDFMWHNELPVGSSSQYAQWCVFRLAKEAGVTVLLDGQGADELLAGYEQYFRNYLATQRLNGNFDRDEQAAIVARYPAALERRSRSIASRLPAGLRRGMANLLRKGSDFRFGLASDIADRLAGSEMTERDDPIPLGDALLEDSFNAHLPTLLRYGDRNSMAHSREVRLPFCDHRLAELALAVAPEFLMGDAQTKRLLRDAMKGVLPEKVRTRWNKQGFLPPQETWIAGPLMGWVEDAIESPAFADRGYWNVSWWRFVLKRFRNGERHLAWQLWRPAMAEAWYQHVVGRAAAMPRHSVFADESGVA